MTGLSGAGKTAIAMETEKILVKKKDMHVYRLDGDNLRFGLNADLGFSQKDRTENVRRTAQVSLLLADAGLISICSLISPFAADRDNARAIHQKANVTFLEVFVDASLETAEKRDPKGLYKKARAGQIKGFTGLDAPYERPQNAEVHLKTDEQDLEQSVAELIDKIWFGSQMEYGSSSQQQNDNHNTDNINTESESESGENPTSIIMNPNGSQQFNSIEDYQKQKYKEYNDTYNAQEVKARAWDKRREDKIKDEIAKSTKAKEDAKRKAETDKSEL